MLLLLSPHFYVCGVGDACPSSRPYVHILLVKSLMFSENTTIDLRMSPLETHMCEVKRLIVTANRIVIAMVDRT